MLTRLQRLQWFRAHEKLREAADILEERGLSKGVSWHKGTKKIDVFAALALALGAPESSLRYGTGNLQESVATRHYGLYEELERALEAKLNRGLMSWNDHPSQTTEKVVEYLRKFAAEIEGA